jgi:endonuclease YncB( thermonuclease family)
MSDATFRWFVIGLLATIALGVRHARCETVDGDCITIIDGDTVALPCDPARGIYPGCAERIRLVGIDAPEVGSHARCPTEATAGRAAKATLAGLIRGRPVEITRTGVDRYRRTLARLSVDGADVDAAMLAAGAAIPYRPGRAAWADRCRHWCSGAARCEE